MQMTVQGPLLQKRGFLLPVSWKCAFMYKATVLNAYNRKFWNVRVIGSNKLPDECGNVLSIRNRTVALNERVSSAVWCTLNGFIFGLLMNYRWALFEIHLTELWKNAIITGIYSCERW